MILLGEAFYCCYEDLDLPLQGSRSRFVALIVGGGCHRMSKYNATFSQESSEYGLSSNRVSHRRRQLMMLKNQQ